VPHGFRVAANRTARILVINTPGGFDNFVSDLGEPATRLEMPEPTAPDVARVIALADVHGMTIIPLPA
jgi:hypothetical protein